MLVSDSTTLPILLTTSFPPNYDGLQDERHAVNFFITNPPEFLAEALR